MRSIQDPRRTVFIHDEASIEDLPINGEPHLLPIGEDTSFTPNGQNGPKLYPGDVIVGVYNGDIGFVDLILAKLKNGVLVQSLDSSLPEVIEDKMLSARFFKADEVHVYGSVTDERVDVDVEYDAEKLPKIEESRER
ncbi:MAG: hypothetical protein PPP58_12285 [Natronomonas sp.]